MTEERDQKLAEIDQEMKNELQFCWDYPEDHYYYCIKHNLNPEKNKKNGQLLLNMNAPIKKAEKLTILYSSLML